ncbi:MAG TPA: 3-oxoacyl-[acyl-carrier-protein] reductase [Dehalococcoidia bacterium]|nr:3-oxoacyl-[acyl-carrier-protein] reductase [Dehalococcoidia bacterium]
MIDLSGRVALITGSSRGIGAEVARALAAVGADIAINHSHSPEQAEAVAAELKAMGRRVSIVQADIREAEQANRLIDTVVKELGAIHILVNNAGTTRDNLTMRMSDEEWSIVMDLNLTAAFQCTRPALRHMMRQRWGRIVNVTSVGGIRGNVGQANYSASKAGLVGLTKSIAREMASRNVTCNAVAPGLVKTKLTSDLSDSMEQVYLNLIPMQRMGTEAEIAAAVVFFASEEARYITGQLLAVDGGLSM